MSTDAVDVGYMLNFHPERQIINQEYNLERKTYKKASVHENRSERVCRNNLP
jgi:hypothetical protein